VNAPPELVDFLELAHAESVRPTNTTDAIAILSRAGLPNPDITVPFPPKIHNGCVPVVWCARLRA
jgi:hypothetical protein